MNQLTKFLVDSILNEGDESLSTVALFGGGFKPPTKGHLGVVLQGLRDNPEVKQVYILVGSGVRNGITQEESVKIWKIYKRFIPVSTQIVAVQSPFSYIKTYLQDHQDENVYIFIGARPDNDKDEKDVAERSAYAKKYSEKAFPVKVTTPGNISGTKARAAAKQSKEAFYQFLPDQLSTQDKEEIYNIILPTLNEVGEGSSKPYKWEEDFDEYVFTTDNNIGYIVSLSLSEMSEGDKIGISVEFLAKIPGMDGYSSKIEVGKGELFRVMATIIDIIKSHLSKYPEIEFILYSPSKKTGEGDIGNQRDKLYKIFLQKQIPGIRIRDIGTSAVIAYLPKRDELNLEINKPGDGNAAPYGSGYNKVDEKKDPKKGTGKKSNRLNENALFNLDIPKFNQPKTIQQYLIENINEINLSKENAVDINGDLTGGTFKVGDIVYEYSIKNISNPYKDLGLFYNIQFTPRGEVTSIPKGGKENYIKILSTMYKIIVDFIEKEKPEYLGISSLDNNKNYHTVYNRLTDNPSNLIPGYFRKDSNLKFNSPQGEGRFIVLKRKKNLNENASYSKDIDVKGKILELTKHMLAKGMNIKPLPKVKFVNGDSNNAREFLGKTAYYNPENQTITLFTEGRHPKDIVRSFAHEMIHHIQNLEDRLGDVSTTNTMEDDNINKLEQEANLKGTMTFRNWTDSLNEDLSNVSLDYIKTKLPKLDSYPKSDIVLSKGDFVYLKIPQDANNPYSMVYEVKVFDIKDGTLVAQSSFDYDNNNNKLKGTLDVRPDKRRMGIATEIYKLAEKVIGDTIFPEEKHTEDAEKFWRQKNRSFGPQNHNSLNEGLLNETPSEVQVKKINISFELFDGTKISEDITLAMSPNSQGLFELGDNIEKYTGLTLKDAQEFNETLDDAYIYGLVNTMNDGQDIFFWTNGTRLAGQAKKLGTQTAIIEQLAHEGVHLTRAILAKSLMGDKFPTGEWPSIGEQDNDTIEEEQLTTALSFVIDQISDPFIEMAKEYIPELNDQSISENLVNEGLNEDINEYNNSGPTTPKVYIVKDDGTYKEAPIELLSKISNLTYDMGGGETNFYPSKNIVIVDNIPVEEFAKEPGDIKGEKIYVEYNLNNPTSLPKANKIIASQLVYHLDNREAFAQTVANSLKDGGTFEFNSDLMNQKDKMFLQHLSDEYGFGLPSNLNQYKSDSLPLKKGEFVEPVISYIYKITDKDNKTATLSVTKKGNGWEYKKIDGDINFKTGGFSTPPVDPDPDFRDKKYTLRTFDKYLSFFGDSNTIVDFEELNEANKPYKHKHGFDDKLGKDPFGLNQFAREIAEEVISEGRYDTLANKLSAIAFEAFKDIHDRDDKEGSFKFRVDNPEDEHDIPSEDFFFDFEGEVEITDGEYKVDGGANAGFDDDGNEITPLLLVKFKIPKNPSNTYPTWQDISFDIKDVVRHELEHLTQDGDNEKPGKYIEDDQLLRDLIDAKLLPKAQYFKLEKEIDAMLQGLYFKAKKSRRPYKEIIDDYLATQSITQEEKNDILKIWRSRVKALSLPLFESEGISELFTIYLDLDGVIADFDKRFTELAGMGPREYEDSFGSEKFWDFIDIKHKIKFFSKMDWMPEGKKLYNFIKQFDHKLLSAPSKNDASKVGKRIWAKENTPETQLILSPAYNKKNYADKSNILIDDRESNIQQWKDAGGIGILFKSTDQVIDELKKIMNL